MITRYHKLALTAGFALAMAFTFGCSSDDKDDGGGSSGSGISSGGGSSSSACESWTEAETTAPTCEAKGVKTLTCASNPSDTKTVEIAKLDWGEWQITTHASAGAAGSMTRTCPGNASPAQTRALYMCGTVEYDYIKAFCQSPGVVKIRCGTAAYTADEGCCGSTKYTLATQFCDSRDRKVYRHVSIGTGAAAQTWMAENLNYNADGSRCYGDNSGGDSQNRCGTYGRLYNWATAMANAASSTTNPSGVQGVCPYGWHLPSRAEWDALNTFISTDQSCSACDAKHLKSPTLWSAGTGLDTYGFSALPGGNGISDGYFFNVGNLGIWWSASEYNSNYAYYRGMYCGNESAYWDDDYKNYLFSVRCLQD